MNKEQKQLEEKAENIKQCLIYLKNELNKATLPFSADLIELAIDGLEDEVNSISSSKH